MHGLPVDEPDSPFYVFLQVRHQITENLAAIRRLRSEAAEQVALSRKALRQTDARLARLRAMGLD